VPFHVAGSLGHSGANWSGAGVDSSRCRVRNAHPHTILPGNEPPRVPPDGQLCGLFAVDVVGFNGLMRDGDIQEYVRKSMYEMLSASFNAAGVPWSGCVHEDRGDGVLVVISPTIPVARLIEPIPGLLRVLIRRHNRVSAEEARIQLRVAAHIGPVRHDGHGLVGHDVSLLCRMLDARPLRRMISESDAEVGVVVSSYIFTNVVRRHPSILDPAMFQPIRVRVKETRERAWAYIVGALPVSGWRARW